MTVGYRCPTHGHVPTPATERFTGVDVCPDCGEPVEAITRAEVAREMDTSIAAVSERHIEEYVEQTE